MAVRLVKPVPPLATLSVPAKVTAPVVPVLGVKPVVPALNDVTPPAAPLDAAVKRPYASTVMLAFVYEPADTAVEAKAKVGVVPPVLVIWPVVPLTLVT